MQSNRSAIGARIKVSVETEGKLRTIYATVSTGGSFGASTLQQEIGLGIAASIRSIEIMWPKSGKIQTFRQVKMDQIVRIREEEADPIPVRSGMFSVSVGQAGSLPHRGKPQKCPLVALGRGG